MSETLLRVLVESALRVSVVAVVIAAMLLALRVRASSTVHAVWSAVLVAMLLMPVLPYGVPAIPLGLIASVPVIDTGVEQPPVSQRVMATPVLPAPLSDVAPASTRPPFSISVADASSARQPGWQAMVVSIYTVGVLILLCRLLVGWCVAKRVLSRAQRIIDDEDLAAHRAATGDVSVCESNGVAVPVTIGVISAAVVLPVTWRRWPGDTLDAVLAHEGAHVKRHDPLIGFLARLNCCVFWFHPLAWWLERRLASTAEHACDDAAVHAVGEPGRYVEILIEMAEAVRRSGVRVSWQGVGMDGGRGLGRRIDCLLAGESWPRMSAARKTVVAMTCGLVIVLVAACQREATQPSPLRDPSRTPEQAQQMTDERLHWADREMPPQVVAKLEASLKTAPDNLAVRERLLFFYWAQLSPKNAARNDRLLAARRALVLWLIDHHPESVLAGSGEARMFPGGSDALTDPVGCDEAKRRWLAHTARPDASAIVIANAANFFEGTEKARAEMLLKRAQVKDPSGPWSRRLGEFYAAALAGRWIVTARQQVRRDVSGRDRNDAYVDSVRAKLVDAPEEVLVPAAEYLLASPRNDPREGLDRDLLAQRLLERALQFNPAATDIHADLVGARTRNRRTQTALLFSNTSRISMYDAVRALPEAQRFELLPDMALGQYATAASAARQWDDVQDYTKIGLEISKKCADEVLRLAPTRRADPTYGTAIYKANIALGSLALHAGDRKAAVSYLRAASDVPVSEELAYSRTLGGAWPLLRELVTQGERASVVEFLNRMAEINVVRRADLRDAAESLRKNARTRLIRAS